MEPDLSSLPAPRPMSPEPTEAKRESLTEKTRPGEGESTLQDWNNLLHWQKYNAKCKFKILLEYLKSTISVFCKRYA